MSIWRPFSPAFPHFLVISLQECDPYTESPHKLHLKCFTGSTPGLGHGRLLLWQEIGRKCQVDKNAHVENARWDPRPGREGPKESAVFGEMVPQSGGPWMENFTLQKLIAGESSLHRALHWGASGAASGTRERLGGADSGVPTQFTQSSRRIFYFLRHTKVSFVPDINFRGCLSFWSESRFVWLWWKLSSNKMAWGRKSFSKIWSRHFDHEEGWFWGCGGSVLR